MKRDIESIVLTTLALKISEISGIPTGRIFAKMPDYEYVNHDDGSIMPNFKGEKYPAIGMSYFGQGKYKINKYGDYPIVVKTPTSSQIYTPMGEICLGISLFLYTNSRREQRLIGNEVSMFLSEALYLNTSGDIIPGQYFSIDYIGFEDLPQHRPYVRVMNIDILAQIFSEATGHVVQEINTSISTDFGSNKNKSEPEVVTNTITGEIYFNEDVTITFGITEDEIKLVTEDGTDLAFEL